MRRASSCRPALVADHLQPELPYRLVHTVIGAYLTTSLVVGASELASAARRR
jgi:cytochrome bd-type quinol oxidase subunit 1